MSLVRFQPPQPFWVETGVPVHSGATSCCVVLTVPYESAPQRTRATAVAFAAKRGAGTQHRQVHDLPAQIKPETCLDKPNSSSEGPRATKEGEPASQRSKAGSCSRAGTKDRWVPRKKPPDGDR